MAFQGVQHLLQAIAGMVEHHYFDAIAHAGHQLLQIGHVVFDKDDLMTRLFGRCCHGRRRRYCRGRFFGGSAFGRRTVGSGMLGGNLGTGCRIDRRTVKHDALF